MKLNHNDPMTAVRGYVDHYMLEEMDQEIILEEIGGWLDNLNPSVLREALSRKYSHG